MTVHPLLQQLDGEMAELVDNARQSLVEISDGCRGHGAGTIWHPDGLVITNAHVVHGRAPQVTLATGQTLPARLLADSRVLDLAALKIDASGLSTVELGDSGQLRAGEWVMALGHPWGVSGAVSSGVVIGVGAEWADLPRPHPEPRGLSSRPRRGRIETRQDRSDPPSGEWLVAGVQLRPGHSGGPMIDAHGRLVGINTMMAGPGVGVAVPVHVVKRFLQQALQRSHV
jgi:serine protease Do